MLTYAFCTQNVVALSVMAIKWIVPNISRDLRDRIRREAYVTNEIIIRTELLKAKGKLFEDVLTTEDHDATENISSSVWTDNECTRSLRQRSESSNVNTGDVTDGRIVL